MPFGFVRRIFWINVPVSRFVIIRCRLRRNSEWSVGLS